jgi:hypothetical protein
MASQLLKAFCRRVGVGVVLAALSGVVALAQVPAPGPVADVQGQSSSAPAPPEVLSYGEPGKHILVQENTMIRTLTDQPMGTGRSKVGMKVTFTVSEDLVVNHVLVIPRGATVHGEVVENKEAGRTTGPPLLTVKLVSLDLGEESVPIYSYQYKVWGTSKEKPTVRNLEGGAVLGALAGDVVGVRATGASTPGQVAKDMAAGAAAGAGTVALAALAAPRPQIDIPAESQMDFYLATPISVQPVSEKDAERLARRLHPGGPVLYVRGDAPF